MLMHTLLLDGANRTPDKPCFFWVDRGRGLTYAEAAAAMDRMAGALHELGVRKGDRVTIFAHNGLDYLVAMLGCWRIGAIAGLVNVKFVDELDYYFADHEPSVVIYTHDMVDAVRRAAAGVSSVKALVCMDGPQDGAHGLPELMAAGLPAPADPSDETAIAHLSYTSGTTGKPKGACLAHEPTVRACRCIAERLRITGDDISFGPSALSSSYQLVGNLLPQLSRGASINVMGRWTAETGYDAIEVRQATMLIANPPILQDLLVQGTLRGRKPGRLRLGLSGGGPVPPQLKAAFQQTLGIPLVESYGQSELGGFVALGFPEIGPRDQETRRVGPPLPDKEVRILGRDGNELPVGAVGEIALRGGFMVGYWQRPEKTAETLRDGWLWTGDLGSMDAEGQVTMRGRRSELIEVGAQDWYPRDVEEALCTDPDIAGAAVVGVPDPALGSRPVAFVETAAAVDADALKRMIAGTVSYDLAPLEIVAIAEMPMTPTGKIAKAELTARARAGL
ncbi:class I adenylate-forming enzyme family protein [Chelativorans sp. AA-79]|uniref:class I adenylate-forming enzyme family protein n=1 Tax=Chelativorans sp. AA-79 TaxID=3028735 RepID=UPI0023F9B07F|nr:class I adenylate-forming enzyme family protein [Chelativorans sp. AA-79]WEX09647.1 class I adenylate-forming enzyme family protein [Chelativorans sp. AA-79]